MEAAHNGHLGIVELLVHNGANPNLEGSHFDIGGPIFTALTCATKNGHFEVVEFLINNKADVNGGLRGALFHAVLSDKLKIAQLLVNNGANVNDIDHLANRPLMQAAHNKSDSFEIIKLLVDHKANIDAQNKYGHTALMIAAGYGRTDIVLALRRNGAYKQYSKAIEIARKKGFLDIVNILEKE